MATLTLDIVSPERLLFSDAVEMAEIPAAEGDMGVLPGHAPMIVTLRGGVIRVHRGGSVTHRLFVAGGFAEVTPERCTVLADDATPVADLSIEDAKARLAKAEAAYAKAAKGADEAGRELAMARLLAARAELAAASAPSP
ncbi:ATP synthase F1 subunit epsilon [Elioraea tepida]|jgi:F-type H+-transporting ATPase subunit epsilon|uniref:ATP synthase epsilon chain n=1 Tax=Elioraea tepida TaxID=2843330 RepID=A0A975U024_9PROT|nr:ATP synthase F1 subunit epsilon [Elioraea tepida]QXM23337.1 ATP synthase F1 subunit epsilon [Elioraea tepida]